MLGLHIAPYKQWLTEWWMIPPGIVPVVRYNSTSTYHTGMIEAIQLIP